MIKNNLIISCCLMFVSLSVHARQHTDSLHALRQDQIRLTGYIQQKLDACIAQLSAEPVDDFVEPFRNRTETRYWQSEFWGKWFTAAADAYRYTGDKNLRLKLDQAVRGLLATQSEDGYIGNYRDDSRLKAWDIWGRKYCMLGLLSYYELTQDKKVLSAVGRLADNLIREVKSSGKNISEMGNFRGMAASSVLEPMVLLYKATGNHKYLDFSEYIVADWEKEGGNGLVSKALSGVPVAQRFPRPKSWFSWENGQKAYEMMSCYEGLLELYRVTGKDSYKKAVIAAAEDIYDTEIMVAGSGASKECWYSGKATQSEQALHTLETCVTATWMKLCNQLLRTTGEAKYAGYIEQSFYNALLGSMTPDGRTWSKYSELDGVRHFGEMQCGMHLNCCMASGPRGMMVVPKMAAMRTEGGVAINLIAPFRAKVAVKPGLEVALSQEAFFPETNEMRITVSPNKTAGFELLLRVPSWCLSPEMTVNGKAYKPQLSKGYTVLKRTWSQGDEIRVKFRVKAQIAAAGPSGNTYAVTYGPLLLAADSRLENQHNYAYLKPQTDQNGELNTSVVAANVAPYFVRLKVPFFKGANQNEPVYLTFCDYASAGNTWDEQSNYRVWLKKYISP